MIPKNYVQELHEVVDTRSRSREASQSRQISAPTHPPPPTTNGGAHAPDHLAQVCNTTLNFCILLYKKLFLIICKVLK